jgi:hypothetical protein
VTAAVHVEFFTGRWNIERPWAYSAGVLQQYLNLPTVYRLVREAKRLNVHIVIAQNYAATQYALETYPLVCPEHYPSMPYWANAKVRVGMLLGWGM